MAVQWLRRLFGLRPSHVTEQTLRSYRASFAQYVTVRTFHSNVRHWLRNADESLEIIRTDGEYNRLTHPQTQGLITTNMENWFSENDYLYHPYAVWSRLVETRESLRTALTHTTPSTQSYHRRMTMSLFDDLAVIEKALHEVEKRHDQHKRTTE